MGGSGAGADAGSGRRPERSRERGKSRGRGRGRNSGSSSVGNAASGTGAVSSAAPTGSAARPQGDEARGGGGSGGRNSKSEKAKRKSGSSRATVNNNRPVRTPHTVTRKLVVRKIPHTIDEEQVLELLATHGVGIEYKWRYVQGRPRGNNRPPYLGRMYLDMKRDDELAKKIIAALNGYVFGETRDKCEPIEVDFAPFQKLPREKKRKDTKVGTIDRDPEYLAFLEEIAKPKEKLPSADVAMAEATEGDGTEKPVAALVKYLNERKIRDKKTKSSGKGYDKSSNARRGGRKKEKAAKEKGKSSKDRSKKGETKEGDNGQQRKSRSRQPGSKKDTSGADSSPVQPGVLKILPSKVSAGSGAVEAGTNEKSSAPRGKKQSGGASKSKPRNSRSEGRDGEKEPNQSHKGGNKGCNRRESRGNRGKEGDGRGEKTKKVFAPKDPSTKNTSGAQS